MVKKRESFKTVFQEYLKKGGEAGKMAEVGDIDGSGGVCGIFWVGVLEITEQFVVITF